MSSLFGLSRDSRNKTAAATTKNVKSSSKRISSGLLQVSGKYRPNARRLRTPVEVFKLEASFESQGTIYPKIRLFFMGAMAVMTISVVVRFILIPSSFTDPNAPFRMDHHSYKSIMSHLSPAMLFLFGAFHQKESVNIAAKNERYIKFHRYVGRVAVSASLIASILCWPVSLNAKHGCSIVYIPWNAFWNYASVKSIYHAWKKEYGQHRLWSNCLVHTAFLFVTSRLFLVLGLALGLDEALTYQFAIFGAAFLAFLWYLLEAGQWARTVAARQRWGKIRAFVLVYNRWKLIGGQKEGGGSEKCKSDSSENKVERTCPGCNTLIEHDVMKCDNPLCKGFNDSAQGEYAQLFLNTGDASTSIPFRDIIEHIKRAGHDVSQLFTYVMIPYVVVYFWMGLPILDHRNQPSFSSLVIWHMVYAYLCVHMAASLFACYPFEWKSMAHPANSLISVFWNAIALLAAGIDAAFLTFCRSSGFFIDQNPTWLISLVISFLPVFAVPYFFVLKGATRPLARMVYAWFLLLLPLAGYLCASFASYLSTIYIDSNNTQAILGLMVALQLIQEILCQVSKATIDAGKKEFGLAEESLPAKEKRTKAQQVAVDNAEFLFVFQDFIFGAYFLCFYREIWTSITNTLICITAQIILLLQEFNMMFGSTILRSVKVIVEGPILPKKEDSLKSSPQPVDRRAKSLQDEFNIRISKTELEESFRVLSFKLLIRLLTMVATPSFGIMCHFGPNSFAYPTWSSMDIPTFLTVLKNFVFMFALEGLFVWAIISSAYTYFRIDIVNLLISNILQSSATRVLFVSSLIHLLQDLYVAIISLKGLT